MPDEPTETADDSGHETGDSIDSDENATSDGVDADADFLADRDLDAYPSVLRLTSTAEATHRRDALDRLARWEAGEDVPHVVNFENHSDLRALLTDRRVELLRSVLQTPPDSIRGLADRLDRDVKSVHDDLRVLAEYEIVRFEQNGRAKRVFVPYDTVELRLEISSPSVTGDTAPA